MNNPTEIKTAYVYKWHPVRIAENVKVYEIKIKPFDMVNDSICYENADVGKTLIPEIGEYFIESQRMDIAFIESISYQYVMYSFESDKADVFKSLVLESYNKK